MGEKIDQILERFYKKEIDLLEVRKELLILFSVSERYLHINDVAALIKSMPTDQAIQKMKASLSGQPETTVIDGDLLVSYHNVR